mmetsp:Transcript_40672/g.91441  ORF Transcript_40672/g.91441 Transcript_40672/m.91441 type:complete len:119 (+) Transcript_40672:1791-2147(+)
MRKSRLAAKWAKRKDMLRRRAVPKGIPFDEKAFDAKFRAQIKKLDDKNSKKQKRLNEEEDSLKMELTAPELSQDAIAQLAEVIDGDSDDEEDIQVSEEEFIANTRKLLQCIYLRQNMV